MGNKNAKQCTWAWDHKGSIKDEFNNDSHMKETCQQCNTVYRILQCGGRMLCYYRISDLCLFILLPIGSGLLKKKLIGSEGIGSAVISRRSAYRFPADLKVCAVWKGPNTTSPRTLQDQYIEWPQGGLGAPSELTACPWKRLPAKED